MAAVPPTPQQQAAKWLAGMQNGGARWADGCNSTQKNLFQNALEKSAQAAANYTRSVQAGGSWAMAMSVGSMGAWKTACSNASKAGRFSQGGQKGQAKYQKFATNAQPVYMGMKAAAAAVDGPIAKVTAALQVLMAAGRRTGSNSLAANS